MLIEVVLQMLICIIYAELFKVVFLEIFKSKYVQDAYRVVLQNNMRGMSASLMSVQTAQ